MYTDWNWEEWQSLDPMWYWGIALLVLFPILIIALNEIGYFTLQHRKPLTSPIRSIRNFILPLVAGIIVLTRIFNTSTEAIVIKILLTIVWVLGIDAGLKIITNLAFGQGQKSIFGSNIPQLFIDIFRVFLVLVGGAVVLSSVWNVELGGLVTALGLGSFVLGLALQDTLGNLFSGVALVYEKPFSVGDYIKVDDNVGQVVEMNWRAVHIETREGVLIVIPHLMVGQNVIRNYSRPTKIHILKQEIGFSYDNPPNVVKEALLEACLQTPNILENPLPEVKTIRYSDSSITYEIEFGIETFQFHEEVMDTFMTRVWYTAQRYDLHIPYPQLTINQPTSVTRKTELLKEKQRTFVESVPLLRTLKSEGKELIAQSGTIRFFGKNEVIFDRGDRTGTIYILLEGKVTLGVQENSQYYIINTVEPNEIFGEVALFSSRKSLFQAQAAKDCKVLEIPPETIMQLVTEYAKFAFKLDEIMDIRRNLLNQYLAENTAE